MTLVPALEPCLVLIVLNFSSGRQHPPDLVPPKAEGRQTRNGYVMSLLCSITFTFIHLEGVLLAQAHAH